MIRPLDPVANESDDALDLAMEKLDFRAKPKPDGGPDKGRRSE